MNRDKASARMTALNYRHGHKIGNKPTPEYAAWQAIIQRCTNAKHPAWHNYGGRGITVCAIWRWDFGQFLADMGPRPDGLEIDRIDNNGNYEPSNCRWATREQNQLNQRPRPRGPDGRFLPNPALIARST